MRASSQRKRSRKRSSYYLFKAFTLRLHANSERLGLSSATTNWRARHSSLSLSAVFVGCNPRREGRRLGRTDHRSCSLSAKRTVSDNSEARVLRDAILALASDLIWCEVAPNVGWGDWASLGKLLAGSFRRNQLVRFVLLRKFRYAEYVLLVLGLLRPGG